MVQTLKNRDTYNIYITSLYETFRVSISICLSILAHDHIIRVFEDVQDELQHMASKFQEKIVDK